MFGLLKEKCKKEVFALMLKMPSIMSHMYIISGVFCRKMGCLESKNSRYRHIHESMKLEFSEIFSSARVFRKVCFQ